VRPGKSSRARRQREGLHIPVGTRSKRRRVNTKMGISSEPLCPCCCRCHATARGEGTPRQQCPPPATPAQPHTPGDHESSMFRCCPMCRAKDQEEERGDDSLSFFGGNIPQCVAHTCPGGWGTPALQRRVMVVSAQPPHSSTWLQISSFIVLIANASTTVKIKLFCAEIRPRPNPTPGRKGHMGAKELCRSFLSWGCRGERAGKYKETSWRFGDFFAACRAGHCWSGKQRGPG